MLVAASLVMLLINSNPFKEEDDSRLPFTYPENVNFVDQKDATVAPLVLGSEITPEPTAYQSGATATPEPVAEETPVPENETEGMLVAEDVEVSEDTAANRFIPPVMEGDYFLPVFDRALRTPDDEMMIAITVDDCDDPDNMSLIIDIADKYDAKLTLFPIGEALMAEGMTRGFRTCVLKKGFELENHTFAHKAEYRISNSELAIQLWKQSIAASYAVGVDYQQHFYRPYNINSVYDQRTHFYIRKLGYKGIAGYTHSYKDFDTVEELIGTIENGKVYQFDMSKDSMAMFETFVAEASRKGYKLTTMNELFGLEENSIGRDLTIDQQTLITMEDYVPTYYDLKLGYRTNSVYALQTRLKELGYITSPSPDEEVRADGIYGPSTSIAVSAFQGKVGIVATGNACAETQEKLFAMNAPLAG